jgi:hypothetical protein
MRSSSPTRSATRPNPRRRWGSDRTATCGYPERHDWSRFATRLQLARDVPESGASYGAPVGAFPPEWAPAMPPDRSLGRGGASHGHRCRCPEVRPDLAGADSQPSHRMRLFSDSIRALGQCFEERAGLYRISIRLRDDYWHSAGNLRPNLPRGPPRHASTGCVLPLRGSLRLSLERVVTGVWVEHHRGSTRRPCAGESRAPGRTLDVVRRSA